MDANEIQALYEKRVRYENVQVTAGEMTPRERFFRVMDFKPTDRIIDTEFGYWNDTLLRWHGEGLPSYVNNNDKADLFFGFDLWRKTIPCNVSLAPFFTVEVVSVEGRHKIIYDSERIKCKVFTDGTDTIPHYLDFPVKDRATYLPFKARLRPEESSRVPADLSAIGAQVKERNYILQANGGSTAGRIRNWMGFEGICLGLYDQPELLNEMLEDYASVSSEVARRITASVPVDLVSFWEDIAYKNGPIVNPKFFNENCARALSRIMDVYRARGTRYAFVDCDGDFRKLIPGWLKAGINILFPLEVAAGMHPERLRAENPGLRMMGGVDKTVLTRGPGAVRQELLRLKPIVEEGGYIPHVDHRVPADVSYGQYLDYLKIKREIFGLPNHTENA